jgi:hypothetical protein
MKNKKPAYNERFGASGGVVSADAEQVHQVLLSFEPFLCPRLRQAATTLCESLRQLQRSMPCVLTPSV